MQTLMSRRPSLPTNYFIPFFPFTDQLNGGEDYTRQSRAEHEEADHLHQRREERSRSRSPRGYLSVRRSPELRDCSRSVSPGREAVQAAAREAAEQAIHLANESDRKSPTTSTSNRTTPDVKSLQQPPMAAAPPATSSAVIQNLLASIATSSSMQMFAGLQQPQLLAAFATLAAMGGAGAAAGASPAPPPVSLAAGLPGMFSTDQTQALQTFAQLQSLFLLNPAAAGQMMPMQQVRNNLHSIMSSILKVLFFNSCKH